jgi:FkbH-like protein
MNSLLARVWSDHDVRLHFVVIDGDHEIFSDVLELSCGWNEKTVSTPMLKCGARLQLFSTSDAGFTLVFNALDVISNDGPAARADFKFGEHAKFVKCVAWDLDNTIWTGILVEDGADQLVLNEEAACVIKELDKRGIVSTVLSKNDHEPAWKLLEKFGLAEYFIFPHINWLPKSGNLQSAAKTININLNSFAFVDDSAFERGEVGEKCPQVRVFKETEISVLLDRPEFNPPISAESAGRRASYQLEMQRVEAAASFDGDYKEFLKSCNINLEYCDLKYATEAEYGRCYELIQRSNQLTLTGNRYSQEAFKDLVSGASIRAWGIRCYDKFGDYGIVGAVVVADEGEGLWDVKEFVMSCRVAKKGCEAMAIGWVKKTTGAKKLSADIVDTGRNGALKEAFKDMQW